MNHSLSIELRMAGARGQTETHELALLAADKIKEAELLLINVRDAVRRDDIELMLRCLQRIANVLGCGNIVMERARIDAYQRNQTSEMCAEGN